MMENQMHTATDRLRDRLEEAQERIRELKAERDEECESARRFSELLLEAEQDRDRLHKRIRKLEDEIAEAEKRWKHDAQEAIRLREVIKAAPCSTGCAGELEGFHHSEHCWKRAVLKVKRYAYLACQWQAVARSQQRHIANVEADNKRLREAAEERYDMVECTDDMTLRNMHALAQEGCRFFYLRPRDALERES